MSTRPALLPRLLAVLAGIFVVCAFALAVLFPPLMTLGRLISQFDHQTLVAVQEWVREQWGEWAWNSLFVPCLVRPAWLAPLALSLVFVGLALTSRSASRMPGWPRWKI